MAIRQFPWYLPRISLIQSPQVNISLQDLSDELKDWSDEPGSLIYPDLIVTTGKQDLGGGVQVGITGQLRNATVGFQQRAISVSQGTVTTPDSSGLKLIDASATFITDGVIRGASIINFTDRSVGTVVNVISETELDLIGPLEDGTDNQFDSADSYKIWNIIQCSVDGGNLVAIDSFDSGGSTISPIMPTFGTQILLTSSSSATISQLSSIEFSVYDNRVHYDASSPWTGIEFPVGTSQRPVNNITDAIAIQAAVMMDKNLQVAGNLTMGSEDLSGWVVEGGGVAVTTFSLGASATLDNTRFERGVITGTLGTGCAIQNCLITGVTMEGGFIRDCVLGGNITLTGGTNLNLINTEMGAVSTAPIVDMGGSGNGLSVKEYNGNLQINNHTIAGDLIDININSGNVTLDSTITDGTISVAGNGSLIDNSTATVNSGSLLQPTHVDELHKLQGLDIDNPMSVSPTQRTSGSIDLDISKVGDTVTVQRQ